MNVIKGKTFRARGPLPEGAASAARITQSALEVFLELRATMPVQYITTFTLIANNEGLSVNEYAKMAGVSKSVMSRHILDIGDRDRYGQEGFGLVVYRARPDELRKHEVWLSDKGIALLYRLQRVYSNFGLKAVNS